MTLPYTGPQVCRLVATEAFSDVDDAISFWYSLVMEQHVSFIVNLVSDASETWWDKYFPYWPKSLDIEYVELSDGNTKMQEEP